MATGFYLLDHKPRINQFKDRYVTFSGVCVMHTAESAPDEVGPDDGAENVAAFIRDRTTYGSYHFLCDSDSIVRLVPMRMQAYGDGTGSNAHAVHISAATEASRWKRTTKKWRRGTVRNMARAASEASDYCYELHGVRTPARRVTKAQSDKRMEGFISHGERDPGRRSDPGADFPWDMFFRMYEAIEAKKTLTRGQRIDKALNLLMGAKGSGNRGESIEAARQALKSIPFLNRK